MTSRDKQGVCISYPHPEDGVGAQFHRSLISLLAYDAAHHGRVIRNGAHAALTSGAQITRARNEIVEQFLSTGIEWLWSIDADMTFEPDTLDRLVAAAHPEKRPIVGGLCFSRIRGDAVEIAPTLYQLTNDGTDGLIRQLQYPPDEMVQVAATGAACVLIHRSVLLAIGQKFPKPWPWFAETPNGEGQISEDVTFCLRAGSLGFPIYVDTSIKIGHVKSVVIDEGTYISQSAYLQARHEALAAQYPVYCVVPVKEDTGKAWPPNTLVIPNDGPLNLSAKWNAGLDWAEKQARDAGQEQWNVAILNDDLSATPDFLYELAAALRDEHGNWISYPDHRGQVPSGRWMATKSDELAGQTMTGWCFMVRGESGLRADEQFRWWYGDSDLERQVRQKGKRTVAVGGCNVSHLHPLESTKNNPELLATAKEDEARFAAKWHLDPAELWLAKHPEFGS